MTDTNRQHYQGPGLLYRSVAWIVAGFYVGALVLSIWGWLA
jgi:hypothetical protein